MPLTPMQFQVIFLRSACNGRAFWDPPTPQAATPVMHIQHWLASQPREHLSSGAAPQDEAQEQY